MIYTADWHLSAAVPVCRSESPEEWLLHQKDVMDFIAQKANELQTGVVIVGDLFDRSTAATSVVNLFLEFVARVECGVYVLIGNHDMEYRDTDTTNTSYGILQRVSYLAPNMDVIEDVSFFDYIPYTDADITTWPAAQSDMKPLLIHTMAFPSKNDCIFGGVSSNELFEKYNNPLIVTGDMHKPFVSEQAGRYHINCGCITKRNTDFKNTQLYIWNDFTPIPLPEDNGVNDEHRVEIRERDERVTLLLQKLSKHNNGTSADYYENLKNGLTSNAISSYSKDVLDKWTGGAL